MAAGANDLCVWRRVGLDEVGKHVTVPLLVILLTDRKTHTHTKIDHVHTIEMAASFRKLCTFANSSSCVEDTNRPKR